MPFVRGHFRKGSWVRPHFRRAPGRGVSLGGVTLALVGLAMVGLLGRAGGMPMPPNVTRPSQRPVIVPASPPKQYIVQVASAVQQGEAKRVARALRAHETRNVSLLRSDEYEGLRQGYWVTFIGPFEGTREGRIQAERVQKRHPGSLVRLIRHRR
jgi:hypothetical protein